jgi:site-specific recombinase XerD
MAKLDVKAKDNPKLQQNKLSDGRISLYLEYYLGRTQEHILDENGHPICYEEGSMAGKPKMHIVHHRKKETLNLYLTPNPRTPEERELNKKNLELANAIRFERNQELKNDKTGKRIFKSKNISLIDYFQSYIDNYTKKDERTVILALSRFKDFIHEKYPMHENIKLEQLTKDIVIDFVAYLQTRSIGEGAKTIYKRFVKVIRYAQNHDIIVKNPCEGVSCKVDENILRKDILSTYEIQKLLCTKYDNQNPEIRKAFIFCLYTGMRYCDVIELRYKNIDYSNKLLMFEQTKTKGHSAASGVAIPLHDDLISLIGEKSKDEYIFHLPSFHTCLTGLEHWVKQAGINKHITWHCARHSFAVNILNNGANIKTLASLLGHSGLNQTEKYTRAVDNLKEAAINSLPKHNQLSPLE